jgi:hypothetical protein
MPILVERQMTEAEVKALVAKGIQDFLASPVPGYLDPTSQKPITYRTAILRGTTAYPYVVAGGFLEKRVKALELRAGVDDVEDAAQAAEQEQIADALAKPIRPRP